MQSALNPEKSSQHINFEQRLDYARAQRKNVKVFVPSTYHNTIDKKALIKADSLLESDSGWVVKSFLMTANGITLKSTNRITQEIRNLIASLRVGDNIIIEEIVVEAPDKSWRSINPIVIKLR
jgi:hypothetical protein